MNAYQLGTQVRVQSAFTAADGVTPIDPDVVTLDIRQPNDVVTTYTNGDLEHLGTGIWAYDLIVGMSGPWIYNFIGSGNLDVASGDQYFTVAQSATVAG